ncbi:hypothetical protein [Chryseobacterium koreense]|nr:hypothetical protein [Chryseobacterium koreense]MBB5333007.1 hypothetical protein [Chryseobacterium koreense]
MKNKISNKNGKGQKPISKTWKAVLELRGTGEILDLKAVLK